MTHGYGKCHSQSATGCPPSNKRYQSASTEVLVCFTLCSQPSSHSGQVSGQQRKKEPEAALGVSPQAPLQP